MEHKEMVNHPKHYNDFDVEVIDMMSRIWGNKSASDFCKLNAFKYRMRAGLKNDPIEDLKKAEWYIAKYHELNDILLVDVPDDSADDPADQIIFFEGQFYMK